ncbi:hypothetical protein Tco_0843872 [Tanacetum coccineum]
MLTNNTTSTHRIWIKYVVPTGRVKVPADRYVVPTGKDMFIVSAAETKLFLMEFLEFRDFLNQRVCIREYDRTVFRALPPSWSQVAITLKTKGGLDYLSFDDLYNKLRTLEIDVKGGSSYDSRERDRHEDGRIVEEGASQYA